jgi:hypothetical protein
LAEIACGISADITSYAAGFAWRLSIREIAFGNFAAWFLPAALSAAPPALMPDNRFVT